MAKLEGMIDGFVADEVRTQVADLGHQVGDLGHQVGDLGHQVGDPRERMAKLEGTIDGFVAGRRDRDAA